MAKSRRIIAARGIATQMMRGPRPGFAKATKRQQEAFFQKFKDDILEMMDHLPGTWTISVAVGAVIMKIWIRYGKDVALQFCDNLRNCNFDGADDPVAVFWNFMLASNGKNIPVLTMYKSALYVLNAYVNNTRITRVRQLERDIFEWDEDFSVPDEYLETWRKQNDRHCNVSSKNSEI